MTKTDRIAMDVWLRFEGIEDEEPTYEANTFEHNGSYIIEWYHTAVGQVTEVEFSTYAQAVEWYETNGYSNFSS